MMIPLQNVLTFILNFGSGALPSVMLDLGLLKISLRGIIFLFLATAGSSNPAGTIQSLSQLYKAKVTFD